MQAAVDFFQTIANHVFTEEKALGDLGFWEALDHQFEDRFFPRGQIVVRLGRCDASEKVENGTGNGRAERGAAVHGLANGSWNTFVGRFEEVAGSAGAESSDDAILVGEHGQHQYFGVRSSGFDGGNGGDPAKAVQSDVEEDDRWMGFLVKSREEGFAGIEGAIATHAFAFVDFLENSAAEAWIVFDHPDTDRNLSMHVLLKSECLANARVSKRMSGKGVIHVNTWLSGRKIFG